MAWDGSQGLGRVKSGGMRSCGLSSVCAGGSGGGAVGCAVCEGLGVVVVRLWRRRAMRVDSLDMVEGSGKLGE